MLCLRDHKKRIAWTGEFYDQSYHRLPTDQEVPRLKRFVYWLQEGHFGSEEGQFQWNKTAGMQIGKEWLMGMTPNVMIYEHEWYAQELLKRNSDLRQDDNWRAHLEVSWVF